MYRETIKLETQKDSCTNITNLVNKAVKNSKVKEGMCNIFLPATTAGLTLNEDDILLNADFLRQFKKIDENKIYSHPNNAFSHLRAAMARQDMNIPVTKNALSLGTWQSILLWEFDTKEREREIVVTVVE
ncbi:MAG: secondary thiamine-phosphate synthase enzyme YjbQ [Candidatus Aenigmatarchaeota archaeon]